MKIKYTFVNGDESEVEVSDEIGMTITDSRRSEHAQERKARYYKSDSLSRMEENGFDIVTTETPEEALISKQYFDKLYDAISQLPELQQRRLLMLAEGLSLQEIARREGVRYYSVWKSVEAARKKIKKLLQNG